MITDIFKNILVMSAAGGGLGVLLLCVKPLTRRFFSPTGQYYVWLTVLIIMILPMKFGFFY